LSRYDGDLKKAPVAINLALVLVITLGINDTI